MFKMLSEEIIDKGKMKQILNELSELQVPVIKVEELVKSLHFRLNKDKNYWTEIRKLFRKLGIDMEVSMECCIEFKIVWPDQTVTYQMVPVFMKNEDGVEAVNIGRLKLLLEEQIEKKIEINYFGKLLMTNSDNSTPTTDASLAKLYYPLYGAIEGNPEQGNTANAVFLPLVAR